ncbi:MAG: tail fiber protein [Saprospiraceae bacterium]|nr:tail fiber protein [Saprospiraceae bacterium]
MQDTYIGTIQIFIFPAGRIPDYWKECDGSLLSTQEYNALFSIIGNKYGGDGVNTFALPSSSNLPAIPPGSTARHFICVIGIFPGWA